MYTISCNGLNVEFIRMCGTEVEYIGFGIASMWNEEQSRAIKKFCLKNNEPCKITKIK